MLLGLVLAIWGIVGYRILATINPTEPNIIEQNTDVVFNPNLKTKVNTFSIKTLNRDPFLGTFQNNKKTTLKVRKDSSKTTIPWPNIIYHGTVSKQNSKDMICVLTINGQQQIMKVGQEVKEVKLIKANHTEVIVSYKKNKKTITKA